MSSIIEGYNYDIFISYRQKDNKHDGWVTEFVDNLKGELEATFKEEISVYFDINPHDGLLETHDVDASLKDKLKCLVFVPIISRTYCDPKSFAWEHEFKAFVEQASQDQFGLKVKLPNGNVAGRVLPVRIYDLDPADIHLCESILGGLLRGVEFIYKSAGVNRPLRSKEEKPQHNLNNTLYRDQINKVANSMKDIIQGLSAESGQRIKEKEQPELSYKTVRKDQGGKEQVKPAKRVKYRWYSATAVIVLLIIAAIITHPKIFKQDRLEKLRTSGEKISVAVMPFQNMTNDTTWNVWQDGIQDILITYLSNSPQDLKVRQIESVTGLIQGKGFTNYASITPSVAKNFSRKLNADVFIYGSINQSGQIIRIIAKITDSKTEDIIKSFHIDGTEDRILPLIDSLSGMISKFLIITKLGKELPPDFQQIASTDSPEAYRYLAYGDNAFFIKRDYPAAVKFYSQALSIDSNFTAAAFKLSFAFVFQELYDEAKKSLKRAYQARDQMSMQQKLFVNYAYAWLYETPYDEIKYLKQVLEFDDQMPFVLESLGYAYEKLFQYDKEAAGYEKALKIYKKWGTKPPWVFSYVQLGTAYHITGQHNKESRLYKKAEKDFPDDNLLIRRQAILALTEGDEKKSKKYIDKYISICKESSVNEAIILNGVAFIYEDADLPEIAEEYYRKAVALQPGNSVRINNLAWFLIDNNRDVEEGMELIDKALTISPDVYYMIDTKGWGFYKQGKYKEALEVLERAWELKPIYDHVLFLHLEAAKKAVAGLKNN
jgi:tetratricopeptide (TPR) repeat protein